MRINCLVSRQISTAWPLMTNTRDKLDEARHFLERMTEIQQMFGRVYDPDCVQQRKYFRYNLNAFLSAFRAVTDNVLVKELGRRKDSSGVEFGFWFDREWNKKLVRSNSDLDFLIRARNTSIHEKSIEPRGHFSMLIRTTGALAMTNVIIKSSEGTFRRPDGSPATLEEWEKLQHVPQPMPDSRPAKSTTPSVVYFFNSLAASHRACSKNAPLAPPKDDVLTVCSTQLGVLESFVGRCEKEFP
jgi:hypothetical protein